MKTFEFIIKNENKVPEPQKDFVFGGENSDLKNSDSRDKLHMLASEIHGSYRVVLQKRRENGQKWLKMTRIDLFRPKTT